MTDQQDDTMAWSTQRDRERSWTDEVDWWNHPHMAYAKGLRDGAAMGREQAYREIFNGLFDSLNSTSGIKDVLFKDAMTRHIRAIEASAERKAWDATAAIPRDGDLKGRAAT
jgi:hypothetical protein